MIIGKIVNIQVTHSCFCGFRCNLHDETLYESTYICKVYLHKVQRGQFTLQQQFEWTVDDGLA